jgi:peptidoglycan/xylan/chitin deacetylase (PgdA/CDA1 family)
MYHYVRDSEATPFPAIRALPPALFEQQLDWLEQHYRLVTLDELESAVGGGEPLPEHAALLTFDDGFIDHYAAAFPILQRRGISGVFFIAEQPYAVLPRVLAVHKTHFLLAQLGAEAFADAVMRECPASIAAGERARVFGRDRWEHADERAVKNLLNYELPLEDADRILRVLFERHLGSEKAFARELYLRPEQIAEMARAGMVFGYHTRTHRMLSRLDGAAQEEELASGADWIRGLTGQRQVPFCYPWGGVGTYTADTLRLLEATGYSVAFNTVRRRVDALRDGRFELPRVDTRDLPPYTSGEPLAAVHA